MKLRMDGSEIVTIQNYLGKATVKVETTSLSDSALDWAVAVCLNLDAAMSDIHHDGSRSVCLYYGEDENGFLDGRSFSPSDDYSDGGKILEKEGISTGPGNSAPWIGFKGVITNWASSLTIIGDSQLEAGLRALIFSKKGPTVRIPAQLLTEKNAREVY